jgi:hypothetical protein
VHWAWLAVASGRQSHTLTDNKIIEQVCMFWRCCVALGFWGRGVEVLCSVGQGWMLHGARWTESAYPQVNYSWVQWQWHGSGRAVHKSMLNAVVTSVCMCLLTRPPLLPPCCPPQALGSKNILCTEDLIHEIFTVGPAFKEASNFLWPFKMNRWAVKGLGVLGAEVLGPGACCLRLGCWDGRVGFHV